MPQAIYTNGTDWLGAVAVRLGHDAERCTERGRVARAHVAAADERGVLAADARRLAAETGLALRTVLLARVALIDAGLLVYLERTGADGGRPQRLQLQLPRP